jgi:hypothetical protein
MRGTCEKKSLGPHIKYHSSMLYPLAVETFLFAKPLLSNSRLKSAFVLEHFTLNSMVGALSCDVTLKSSPRSGYLVILKLMSLHNMSLK